MPDDTQDPTQDQDQTPDPNKVDWADLFPMLSPLAGAASAPPAPAPQASAAPTTGQPGPTDPLANMFRAGTGVSQQPSPIDAPDLAQFNREYNTPGSAYYVSPARRILQSFLTGIMAGPEALANEGFNPSRQQKYQQWLTDQQRVMEAQHWNSINNVQYMRQQQINARSAQREQLQRDQMTMKDSEFQQRYGLSKAQLQLAQQRQQDYIGIQNKKLQNQQLNQQEKVMDQAYPQAMQQGFVNYVSTHPGATMQDALSDPSFLPDVQQRFEQMKPQASYNAALQKAYQAGDLAGVDPSKQAAVYKALQESKTLSPEEKGDVATYLLPQMQTQSNALQKGAQQVQGKIAAAEVSANRPSKQIMYVPQDDGTYSAIEVHGGTTGIPGSAVTSSGVNQLNVPTAVTRGAGEQGGIIQTAGQHLIDVINQNRGKLGNTAAVWNNIKNNSPIADPETSYLKSLIGSFAALQPRLHGMRGGQVMQEFEKLIGGVPKNPDALIGGIQGIMDTAGTVKAVGKPQAASKPAAAGGVPSVGDTFQGSKVTSVTRIK